MNSGQGPAERYRPRHGRHRPEANALSWTPEVPRPEPPPLVDPVADTAPPGLRKFDLGMVPASVTPPRTWKRAAWFAGLSSATVLLVLVAAATALVSPGGDDQLEALPGYPADVVMPDGGRSSTGKPAATSGSGTRASGSRTPAAGPRTAPTSGAASGPVRLTGDGSETRSSGGSSSAAPVTTVTNDRAVPLVPVNKLADQTAAFFAALPQDPQRAFEVLAGPALKDDGYQAFQQRFDNLQRVEVKTIQVDPGRGVTTSVVEVQTKDGALSTQQRELTFTVADVPLVNGERLVSAAER